MINGDDISGKLNKFLYFKQCLINHKKGTTENIKINNGCWIGANSTIVGGVTVGESSIIGTCSLVLKNVEKSVIVGGNPAKTIKKL